MVEVSQENSPLSTIVCVSADLAPIRRLCGPIDAVTQCNK